MTISPTVEDLKQWLDKQGGRTWLLEHGERMPIRPDLEDYPAETQPTTNATQGAQRYRLAQAHKLIRLYKVWYAEIQPQ
jgi:hypothetical protein